jgi:hypothetical protein
MSKKSVGQHSSKNYHGGEGTTKGEKAARNNNKSNHSNSTKTGANNVSSSITGGSAAAGNSSKQIHSRSYPRGVGLDFRKLAGLSLINYIDHHGTFLLDYYFVKDILFS